MKRLLRENGLSLALLAIFAISIAGQFLAGYRVHAEERGQHGESAPGPLEYLGSGHFLEAVFENWESEFLQMAVFVVLTAVLRQRGSSESKRLDREQEEVDRDVGETVRPESPRVVHRGGLLLTLYSNSLTIALVLLFVASFALHAYGGMREQDAQELAHGGRAAGSLLAYVGTSQFWFQSSQNWQSEFISVAALVLLATFLRQKGSPQSKPVAAPHRETESEAEDRTPG